MHIDIYRTTYIYRERDIRIIMLYLSLSLYIYIYIYIREIYDDALRRLVSCPSAMAPA